MNVILWNVTVTEEETMNTPLPVMEETDFVTEAPFAGLREVD